MYRLLGHALIRRSLVRCLRACFSTAPVATTLAKWGHNASAIELRTTSNRSPCKQFCGFPHTPQQQQLDSDRVYGLPTHGRPHSAQRAGSVSGLLARTSSAQIKGMNGDRIASVFPSAVQPPEGGTLLFAEIGVPIPTDCRQVAEGATRQQGAQPAWRLPATY